ncbi:DUF1868 domain-containing protein [Pseudomonas gingeri]|uniref:DUF1868 domain-containing protein n=1 Tax=Pseudomonas gingeri TaxID=117681 RepID=A0A7Y7XC20_9PSED|nr:DUF1868 domain-containing protein [Pseudomonas gingeri]NWB97027.1 DUF1868 domain-containing protein [Pseudomonas gingeri]
MMNVDTLRRAFMLQATVLTVGAAFASSPTPSSQSATPHGKGDKPYDVNRKFYEDGKARPFTGNTIISQIPLHSPIGEALTVIRNTLASHAFSKCWSLLPPSSYHMTVFEGVIDERRKSGFWPAQVPKDAPLQTCTDYFVRQLMDFALNEDFPVRLLVDDFDVNKDSDATLRLVPANPQENLKLRGLRDRLSERMGIRAPGHDDYRFHITLGYLVQWMDDRKIHDCARVQRDCLRYLRDNLGTLELDVPQFCTFNDMLAFDDKFAIGQRPRTL